ncbi:MAG: L-histidine N(alpha)-methyltransferase [Gammaproteobacteria bacterium]|nr:L-histidine N(alpha)-methyltransferase [Gammaproteobacteria bacterium]
MVSNALARQTREDSRVRLIDQSPQSVDMTRELLEGLRAPQKSIAPKYFYDEQGSRLFERITRLPEYYLTRTETGILRAVMREVAELVESDVEGRSGKPVLVECGSGSGEKARIVIDGISPQAYLAIDISKEFLVSSCEALSVDYPDLDVYAVCADYSQDWSVSEILDTTAPLLAFFPGSSFGNFEPDEAVTFLARAQRAISGRGSLLIGIDPPKDVSVLEAAYNDSAGVTARFNLNLLTHMNWEFGANFDLSGYRHKAIYNPIQERIEMYLVSQRDQEVRIGGERIFVAKDEVIHTENSYKYSYDRFVNMAREAGFRCTRHWTDEAGLFSVFLLGA